MRAIHDTVEERSLYSIETERQEKRKRGERGSRRAEQARASAPSTTLTKLRTGLEIGLLE